MTFSSSILVSIRRVGSEMEAAYNLVKEVRLERELKTYILSLVTPRSLSSLGDRVNSVI